MIRSNSKERAERIWFLALMAGLALGAWLRGAFAAENALADETTANAADISHTPAAVPNPKATAGWSILRP